MTWLPDDVKRLRQRLLLTQEAMAARLNVSFSTISRWETGAAKPSRMAQEKLASLAEAVPV